MEGDTSNLEQEDFKIDSGGIRQSCLNAMRPRPKQKPITTTLLVVAGPLESKGQFIAHTEVKGHLFHFRIVVVSAKANNLLSRSVASRTGFIFKVEEFEETLSDTRCVNTEPVRNVLRGGAEPYALSVVRRGPNSRLTVQATFPPFIIGHCTFSSLM